MKKRSKTTTAGRKEPTSRLRTYAVIAACALLMVGGFFFAARQHFSSIDYGMKNSRLRRQVDELEAEKRRLMLAREISISPIEILKAAKKWGLVGAEPVPSELVQLSAATQEKAKLPVASVSTASQPLVVKAAAITAAPRPVVAADAKPDRERVVKVEKRSVPTE